MSDSDVPPAVLDLTVERLVKLGVDTPLLHDVTWTIRPGEHWALIGPNGSGKSSLLTLVSGEQWPTAGRIFVLGHEYGRVDKRDLKRHIGVVSPGLTAWFPPGDTARDVVVAGAAGRLGRFGATTGDERRRAEATLARVGALECADKAFAVLSTGERQRVMIAHALVRGPRLLILDEPCTGLDPVARERFLADLATLAASPDAPHQVLVTHHLEEVPAFVTHALVLARGTTVAQGEVDDVLTSGVLSAAFGAPCQVERALGRLSLHVGAAGDVSSWNTSPSGH